VISTLGDLGDFIGGIAVVITLIYLAIQVRQNTSALKAASWQEVVSGARQAARLRGDPDVAPAWAKGLSHYPDMPAEDMSTFSMAVTDEALFFQGVYALHQSGQLDDSVYEAYLQWFAAIINTPGGSAWWTLIGKPIFVPKMVETVSQRLAQGGLPDIQTLPGVGAADWQPEIQAQ